MEQGKVNNQAHQHSMFDHLLDHSFLMSNLQRFDILIGRMKVKKVSKYLNQELINRKLARVWED